MTVDPTGRFAYVTTSDTDSVFAFTIDNTTGALSTVPGSPFQTGRFPEGAAVDPTGQYLYVGSNRVWAYSIDGTTGALMPLPNSPFAAGSTPVSVAITQWP